MNERDAIKIVHDWLWESDERLTVEQTWLHNYVRDVASMLMAATAKLQSELASTKNRIMDLEEALKEEVDTNEAYSSLLRDCREVVKAVAEQKCCTSYSYEDCNGDPARITEFIFANKAQSLIPAIDKALEKTK